MISVLEDVRVRESSVTGATGFRRHVGALLWLVAGADLLVLTAAMESAWQLRMNLDVWTSDSQPYQGLPVAAAVGIVVAWLTMLVTQGAYSRRYFGAGQEEFKVVYLASVIAAGSVGVLSYLLKLDLSRGFVVLAFFLGTPMLLS